MRPSPVDTSDTCVVTLGTQDIPAILELEKACWLSEIRADEHILEARFALDHITLGLVIDDALLGIVSFSYTVCSPERAIGLPQTFREFSSRPMALGHNTAFAYNLNIHPRARGGNLTMELVEAGLNRMRRDGCRYLLGVGRCPSYNGSMAGEFENMPPSPEFRCAIDKSIQTGKLPALEELLADPVLRFYRRSLGCEFIRVMPDFLPGDAPSGGIGVIFYLVL